jgi:hypothetical protein
MIRGAWASLVRLAERSRDVRARLPRYSTAAPQQPIFLSSSFRIFGVRRTGIFSVLMVFWSLVAGSAAQEQPANPPSNPPQVQVHMLNVCTPSAEEQKEIASALGRIPKQPLFGADFEVSRGRSTLTDMPSFLRPGPNPPPAGEPPVASYVRIRREFAVQALFASLQYSFSDDGQNMIETLVMHVRDPKDLMEVSIEDSASAVTSAEAMLVANTPANRIRLERFGKASIALARCLGNEGGPPPDQSVYEPLFGSASEVLANYRGLLGVRTLIPQELARISGWSKPKAAAKANSTKSSSKQ